MRPNGESVGIDDEGTVPWPGCYCTPTRTYSTLLNRLSPTVIKNRIFYLAKAFLKFTRTFFIFLTLVLTTATDYVASTHVILGRVPTLSAEVVTPAEA